MPQEDRTSRSPHRRWTGIEAYWPRRAPWSRATQISGPPGAVAGLSRYCHRQRRRLDSASASPKTARYSRNSSSSSAVLRGVIAMPDIPPVAKR